MTRRRWLLSFLAGTAIALLLARVGARIYTDYLWYAALGAADVWRAKYGALLALRLLCAAVATMFVFLNLYAVRQSVVSLVLPRRIGNIDIGEEVPRPRLTWTAAALSLVIGVGLAWSRDDWSTWLAASLGQDFGESDPYLSTDLGFFVFRLPLEVALFRWTMAMVLGVIGLVVLLYALTPSLRWEQGRLYISGYVRRHLAMLAGALLLVLAWHYRLEMYLLLGNGSAIDGGFASIDHRIGIPASLVLAMVTLGCGLVVLWSGWTGQLRLAFAALTALIVAVAAGRYGAPFIARRVAAGEAVLRERSYEATRKGYTRRAFAVDRVIAGDSSLMFPSLGSAAPFVPAWDAAALLEGSDRPMPAAAVGWLASDSGLSAVVLGQNGQPHAPLAAASAGDDGLPARLPVRDDAMRPPIHVVADGRADDRVIADSTGRVAAPLLNGPLVKIAHALSLQDLRLWLGETPSPSPKVIARRDVRGRLRALAPWFAQGESVTPIWVADSLLWSVDLYSTSGTYPLSRRQVIAGGERAYFQHAATALINATTGRVSFVADSLTDPVARTWRTSFPRLFVRPAALPTAVRRQLPPAREGVRAQATAYARYGARDETTVARRLPEDAGPDSAIAGTPAPLLGFPRQGTTGYVLPLLDREDRVQGLFIGLGGTSPRSVWLPSGPDAPVWTQSLDRLRAADTMSAGLLVRGYVRAIPVAGRLLLAQPRYDWRGGTPRLLYVSALMDDSVRSARTLLALAGRDADSSVAVSDAQFRARARQLVDEMRRASGRSDWTAYGRAFDALTALVRGRQD